MDDHEGKPQPSGFHLNGLLPDQSASVTRVLDTERWSRAEKRVAQLIDVIQPNQASENRRNAIESYMRRLITECFSCQLLHFGFLRAGEAERIQIELSLFLSGVVGRTVDTKLNETFGLLKATAIKSFRSEIKLDSSWYLKTLKPSIYSDMVVAYGSVPLKTYLPDGDIDLVAFSKSKDLIETWCIKVKEVLDKEMKREDAEFRVKEVQIIYAKIMLVKCIVENIVVDISFNQLSGLCALCYLEEVDNLIKRSHLFKRSIILIKAWCYYESRTMGGGHGLFSTYALETLVLYIFHVFNNSFAGPLEVLYRFVEFVSKFDWKNFCVSLWGPVPKSSIADMAADLPRSDGGELCLSKSIFASIATHNVLPLGRGEPNSFPWLESFNIIDPLLTNNNLGVSVKKGSFFRILGAFAAGAQKLARLLDCPIENLITEVDHIFQETWDRLGKGYRLDAPSPEINVSAFFHTGNQKAFANTTSSMASYQNKGLRNISPDEQLHTGKGRGSSSGRLRNQAHGRNWFGRPHSNPELTDTSANVPSGWRHSSRRNLNPQVFDSHSAKSPTEDQLSSGQHLFHQSTVAANPHGEYGFGYAGFQMYQPRQDYNFVGHVVMRDNFAYGHAPHLLPPPFRYNQMIPADMARPNIPAFDPRWFANMHALQNLAPLPASQSWPGVAMASNQEERTEPGASNLTSTELNQEDGGDGVKKS